MDKTCEYHKFLLITKLNPKANGEILGFCRENQCDANCW